MPAEIYAMPDSPDTAGTTTVPAVEAWAKDTDGSAETGVARVWRDAYQRISLELSAARSEASERRSADHRRLLDEISKGYERARDAYQRGLDAGMKIADQAVASKAQLLKDCASSRLPIDYIRGAAGEGYIYAVGFTTSTVKVGHTEDPKQRLGTHQNEALAYGVGITGYWISPPHFNYKANETELIRLCLEVSRRSRREYFHELTLTDAIDLAWTLKFNSVIPDQLAYACGFSLS